MTSLIPFTFENTQIRTTEIDGATWYVLADVCKVLEISNPSKAAERLDEDEKTTLTNSYSQAGMGAQAFTMVNESGLYHLCFTSRKSAAKRLRKWNTSEVLPSIRKTGSYSIKGEAVVAEPKGGEPRAILDPPALFPDAGRDYMRCLNLLADFMAKSEGISFHQEEIFAALKGKIKRDVIRRVLADLVYQNQLNFEVRYMDYGAPIPYKQTRYYYAESVRKRRNALYGLICPEYDRICADIASWGKDEAKEGTKGEAKDETKDQPALLAAPKPSKPKKAKEVPPADLLAKLANPERVGAPTPVTQPIVTSPQLAPHSEDVPSDWQQYHLQMMILNTIGTIASSLYERQISQNRKKQSPYAILASVLSDINDLAHGKEAKGYIASKELYTYYAHLWQKPVEGGV